MRIFFGYHIFAILTKFLPRYITSCVRKSPDFIIVGAQKGGTTALFRLLSKHPQIKPPLKKEIHFFDKRYRGGMLYYKSFFL